MIKDLLGARPEMEVFDMMALGRPVIRPPRKFVRELAGMIHWNRCKPEDFRTDEQVRDFIKKARNRTIGTHRRGSGE